VQPTAPRAPKRLHRALDRLHQHGLFLLPPSSGKFRTRSR
jgi:hypothetical protein